MLVLRYLFSALSITAFEELEKALSTAQKTEDAQRRMKVEMDEQIKAVERAGEEERLRLQHELSRVRQEAVSMAKVRMTLISVASVQCSFPKSLWWRRSHLDKALPRSSSHPPHGPAD